MIAAMLVDNTVAIVLSSLLLVLAAANILNVLFKEDLPESFPIGTFFSSLILKVFALIGIFFLPAPAFSFFALIVMSSLLDVYITSRFQGEYLSKYFVFLILALVALHPVEDLDLLSSEFSVERDLSTNLLCLAVIFISFYQVRLLNASWRLSFSERILLKATIIFSAILSASFIGILAIDDIFTDLTGFEYSRYFVVGLLAAAFCQSVVFMRVLWILKQKSMERSKQIDHEYNIWNAYGFVKNVENVRKICSRLDQGVTLAVFKVEDYEHIQQSMSVEEFLRFKKSIIDLLKFSLRKHDQLAALDQNIFAVLLPFTDLVKGEMACIRLREQARKEIRAQGFVLPGELGMRFGLTYVGRKEPNVLDALMRAAQALAKAKPFGINQN